MSHPSSSHSAEDQDIQIFNQLKTVHFLLKNFLVGQAMDILSKLDIPNLTPGLRIYALHLMARCKLQDYDKTWDTYELVQADRYLTELVQVAYENHIKPKNPNYLFTRALVKWTLAKELQDKDDAVRYRDHANRLVHVGRGNYPDHSGFVWLEGELNQAA